MCENWGMLNNAIERSQINEQPQNNKRVNINSLIKKRFSFFRFHYLLLPPHLSYSLPAYTSEKKNPYDSLQFLYLYVRYNRLP